MMDSLVFALSQQAFWMYARRLTTIPSIEPTFTEIRSRLLRANMSQVKSNPLNGFGVCVFQIGDQLVCVESPDLENRCKWSLCHGAPSVSTHKSQAGWFLALNSDYSSGLCSCTPPSPQAFSLARVIAHLPALLTLSPVDSLSYSRTELNLTANGR
jgi:hypothetical protein